MSSFLTLCYVLSKFGVEKVRSIAYDFYNADQVSVVKKRLLDDVNKKTVLSQGNRAMPQLFFSV